MHYEVEFKPRAEKDLANLSGTERNRILEKISEMSHDLRGDVKKLTNFSPKYRLRAGNYRVLFNIELQTLVIYRVLLRKDAYR